MNDHDLIDELRQGLRAHTDHTEVPDGFAQDARRTARGRSARRAATAGTPLLAAAGIATVVVAGVGRSSSHDSGAPNVNVSAGGPQDITYVVRRVKAHLAADSQDGAVIQTDDYRTGQLGSDGSLINLGRKVYDAYEYTAPDGTEYSNETYYNPDGSVEITGPGTYVPDGNHSGTGTETDTVINPAKHEYSRQQYSGTPDPDGGTSPSMSSTPAQVQQALQAGQVTDAGTATINGTPAIALTFTMQSEPPANAVLYVDAQSDQPLRMAWQVQGAGHVLSVENWMEATTANIALAQDNSIPAGYTEAPAAQVY